MLIFENAEFKPRGLQGYVRTTFDYLKKVLGKPTCDLRKTKQGVEWRFTTSRGVSFTIYNVSERFPNKTVYDWSIGGNDEDCITAIKEILPYCQVFSTEQIVERYKRRSEYLKVYRPFLS